MGQKKKTGEKQPKETDKIKKKLERVATLKRRIDNLIERLEYLESTMGSASTPNLTGCGWRRRHQQNRARSRAETGARSADP